MTTPRPYGATPEPEPTKVVTTGVRTTEFWIAVLTSVGALLAALAGGLNPKWAAVVTSASTIAYGLSRGLAKQ